MTPASRPELPKVLPVVGWSALGVQRTAEGFAFAVHAGGAEYVDLCLYLPGDATREVARVRMQRTEAGVWRVHLAGDLSGWLYGFRTGGVWAPERGLFYGARKLLLDPYARAVVGDSRGRRDMLTMVGWGGDFGKVDNGASALKAAVVDESFDWGGDCSPAVPWRDMVVYELHVKGFTRLHPEVPEALRGTYAGLAQPVVIDYLKDLGVTTVQLLPVHQHLDDGFLVEKGLTNYWGYNTLGFFAPHAEYASVQDPSAVVAEVKGMVKALHAAGLEVILDVVYNHTAEGDENGPCLMFRGLDQLGYYRMIEVDGKLYHHNCTGCGNAVAGHKAPALQLMMDSLRYWVTEMHVDGFRFDLAVTVARGPKGYDRAGAFFSALNQDPVLRRVKWIAEPWDVGEMDSYQQGNFPAPWRELNGKFRDAARSFWRGDKGEMARYAKRFSGSQDLFGWDGRPPTASVNLITSHDGFTLRDLVSYEQKHNWANGEENRDGDNANHSSNSGVEGETEDVKIPARRLARARALLAGMICAKGVPFLTAGDERWRTQQGNNNAYCQDNELNWLDWSEDETGERMRAFVKGMLAFRAGHEVMRRDVYFDGRYDGSRNLRDVTWLAGDGGLLEHGLWHEPGRRAFGMLVDAEPVLLFLFNAGEAEVEFLLPGEACARWVRVFDTALESSFVEADFSASDTEPAVYAMQGCSMVCLRLGSGSCLPVIAV